MMEHKPVGIPCWQIPCSEKEMSMLKNLLVSATLILFSSSLALADTNCKKDEDCKGGDVCILAMKPPVCKPPQAAGKPCKRDKVCASGKCELPAGKDVGVCK
jgi:hypothetical protein